ncbi:MAG: ribonuclease III domain-containing protein [Eubacteriales bacterium]|nr:ribonuclease III [Clostridiales bacterium]MDY5859422.1 ribonuclease III domain-containing protein [Eubacteriales bacterium]
MTDKRADITPAALAYLGDSVIEVLARERLVSAGIPDSARLNLAAAKYVRATVQSDAVERILPLLDEAEAAVYRRARNVGHTNTPRSASPAEYRRATGMEALFGWLWLGGEEGKTRARELFCAAYGNEN